MWEETFSACKAALGDYRSLSGALTFRASLSRGASVPVDPQKRQTCSCCWVAGDPTPLNDHPGVILTRRRAAAAPSRGERLEIERCNSKLSQHKN